MIHMNLWIHLNLWIRVKHEGHGVARDHLKIHRLMHEMIHMIQLNREIRLTHMILLNRMLRLIHMTPLNRMLQ